MKKGYTSIIMNTYIKSLMISQMTMASLSSIRKYTDQPYEIIVIDNEPEFNIRDDYGVLKIDKYFKNDEDMGCYASYNFGASKADGEFLVFIQNDVFVHEGWLPGLRKYLETGFADVVYPDQSPRSRQEVLEAKNLDWKDPRALKGSRDAGLMMITRSAYDRCGGWPEGVKTAIMAEKFMYERISNHNLRWTDTRKVMITHIMAATNFFRYHEDFDEYNRLASEEERVLKDKS